MKNAKPCEGFNYGSCVCLPSCDQKDFNINSVHYGKWRQQLLETGLIKGSGTLILSMFLNFVIFLVSFTIYSSDMQEIVYQEEPDYPFHSFISDIGGATGVILGISFATVFGAIDFAFAHFIGKIKLDL